VIPASVDDGFTDGDRSYNFESCRRARPRTRSRHLIAGVGPVRL